MEGRTALVLSWVTQERDDPTRTLCDQSEKLLILIEEREGRNRERYYTGRTIDSIESEGEVENAMCQEKTWMNFWPYSIDDKGRNDQQRVCLSFDAEERGGRQRSQSKERWAPGDYLCKRRWGKEGHIQEKVGIASWE